MILSSGEQALSTANHRRMNRSVKRVTKIDVGTPPYASSEWETFEFNFHGFFELTARRGQAVRSSDVAFLGHRWFLKLYPQGSDGSSDDMVSLTLCKKSSFDGQGITVRWKINILCYDGDEFFSCTAQRAMFHEDHLSHEYKNFINQSTIMEESDDILVDGTLVVQLEIKSAEQTSLPCAPFVPDNSCWRKMEKIYYLDEKYADVFFLFPQKKKSNEEVADREIRRFVSKNALNLREWEESKLFAHRIILQACAPGLAELCEPFEGKVAEITLSNVCPSIFELLLDYVYGRKISYIYWRDFAEELIDVADRYGVSDLKLEAEVWLIKFTNIHTHNAMDLLLYADAKNLALLKESVMDFFAKNGKDVLQWLSFDKIPESKSLFTDLLLAVSVKNEESSGEGGDYVDPRLMRISRLRRELEMLNLDTDGSREILIKRLETEGKYADSTDGLYSTDEEESAQDDAEDEDDADN